MFFNLNIQQDMEDLVNHKGNGIHYYSFFKLGLTTEIEISSSSAKIYKALIEFHNYTAWNPSITEVQGTAKMGTLLKARIQWPGLKNNNYLLKITELIPNYKIRWIGHFWFKYFLDGDHIFLIQETDNPQKTTVKQSEMFTGFLVPIFSFFLKRNIFNGFLLLNQSLKNYVEGLDR